MKSSLRLHEVPDKYIQERNAVYEIAEDWLESTYSTEREVASICVSLDW